MSKLVSIIIPVYNHEKALERALDSISKQTYKDIEVIIVDDGNDKELRIKNNGLKVNYRIIRQEHKGAPAARNRGFRESKGDYVIFWDADVIAKPDMLEKMIRTLEIHPEASYVYSSFSFGWKKMSARVFDMGALKKNNYIHSTSLIRSEAVVPWDETLKRFQDWDLWLTMAEQGKYGVWIPDYLFDVIPRRGGMSSWLPAFAYRAPWRYLPFIHKRILAYEKASEIVMVKHQSIHALDM